MFKLTIFCCILFIFVGENFAFHGLDKEVHNHFETENHNSFKKTWQLYRKGFESAIVSTLKSGYGQKPMNIYVRRSADSYALSNGLFISDNVVQLMLYDLYLTHPPQLLYPDVAFALASHLLAVRAKLSRIIVDSNYFVFRPDVPTIPLPQQDPYGYSPFASKQVDKDGRLTIIAEDCWLFGKTVAKLSGHSVHLGFNDFKVASCKFSIEISDSYGGSPPIIVPYFSQKEGRKIETLLSKPIREEIMTTLQGAVFSLVNTSSIFGSSLPGIIKNQNSIFEKTTNTIGDFVGRVPRGQTSLPVEPFYLRWLTDYTEPNQVNDESATNDTVISKLAMFYNEVTIKNITIYATDTLYTANKGGPFNLRDNYIGEVLRFNSLMVYGDIFTKQGLHYFSNELAVEIKDLSCNLMLTLSDNAIGKRQPPFEFIGWRAIEIAVSNNIIGFEKIPTNDFVHAVILSKIPNAIEKYLQAQLDEVWVEPGHDENKLTDEQQENASDKSNVPESDSEKNDDTKLKGSDEKLNKDNVTESRPLNDDNQRNEDIDIGPETVNVNESKIERRLRFFHRPIFKI